jgi:hypothetical protein
MMGDVMPTSTELRAKALDMAHRARQLQVEVDQLNDKDRKTAEDWSQISVLNEKIRHALSLSSVYANVGVAAALEGQANKL